MYAQSSIASHVINLNKRHPPLGPSTSTRCFFLITSSKFDSNGEPAPSAGLSPHPMLAPLSTSTSVKQGGAWGSFRDTWSRVRIKGTRVVNGLLATSIE